MISNGLGRSCINVLAVLLIFGMAMGTQAGFQVSGTQLLDANGNPFIMRGVNHPHTWFLQRTQQALEDIAGVDANAVRVVLSDGQQWSRNSASDVAQVIDWAKQNQLITILEVHDVTGSGEQASAGTLANTVDYWIDIAGALQGQEDYVLINIANEPFGNGVPASTWVDEHVSAIQRLRDAGLTHTLIVDAGNWGQDWQGIMLNNASSVAAADELNNTMFSVHMYEVYQSRSAVENYVNTFLNTHGVPLIVGEFGAEHFGQFVDAESVLAVAEEYGMGYLGWSWSGNNADVAALDITLNWDVNNLSSWGDLLINGANGIKATAELASVFTDDSDSDTGSSSGGDGSSSGGDGSSSGGDDSSSGGSSGGDGSSSGGSSGGATQCNWYGTLYPLCQVTQTGWGWEKNQSCISPSTCSDQPDPYGIVDSGDDGSGDDGSGDDGTDTGTGLASCEYLISNEWNSGYTGAIRITNVSDSLIEGWTVDWELTDGSSLDNLWNAELSGDNPYSASDLGWNANIQPDQSVEFGFQVNKGSVDIEVPEVMGFLCQ